MLPKGCTLDVESFRIDIPQSSVDELKTAIKSSRITRPLYENGHHESLKGVKYGVKHDWLIEARDEWLKFDWGATESRLNALPQYLAKLKLARDDKSGAESDEEYTIHFVALVSKRPDAVPIIFSHGWPGLFLEFVPMLEKLKKEYGDDLPFHAIVPSVPGYAFSSPPPSTREFTITDVGVLWDQLMQGLGFPRYVAQGGDFGAYISHEVAKSHGACSALHLNFVVLNSPPKGTEEYEQMIKAGNPPPPAVMQRMQEYGYALEHGTKPATIGSAVGASPIGLLAWLGEKYMLGLDGSPFEILLPFLSIYWFTDCFGSSIWLYKTVFGPRADLGKSAFDTYVDKPTGFSQFPREIARPPRHWVEKVVKLVWYKQHEKGGHFAALERPDEFTDAILDFLATIRDKSRL